MSLNKSSSKWSSTTVPKNVSDELPHIDFLKAMGMPLNVQDQIKRYEGKEKQKEHIRHWIHCNRGNIAVKNVVPESIWEKETQQKFGVTKEMCEKAKRESSNVKQQIANVLLQRADQLFSKDEEDESLQISEDEGDDNHNANNNNNNTSQINKSQINNNIHISDIIDGSPNNRSNCTPRNNNNNSNNNNNIDLQLGFTEHLQRYEKPKPSYFETSVVLDLLKKIQSPNLRSNIVHIYGVGGCGKSEVIRRICHVMCEEKSVVWQITCNENLPSFRDNLKDLSAILFSQAADKKSNLCTLINGGSFRLFMKEMFQINMMVLIAVDNVCEPDRHDVEEFIKEFDYESSWKEYPQLFAVLVSSRRKNAIFPDLKDKNCLNTYSVHNLAGFSEKEAEEFLCKRPYLDIGTNIYDGARQLANYLCYSPLRMIGVKQFCHKQQISYRQYIDAKYNEEKIFLKAEQIEFTRDFFDNDGYDIIIEWFNLNYTKEEIAPIQMMSFLDCDNIPVGFLERIIGFVTNGSDFKINLLLSRLRDDDYFQFRSLFQSDHNMVSVHEDVFFALRNKMSSSDASVAIQKLLNSFAKFISKDNRESLTSLQYFNMINHMQFTLIYAEKYLKINFYTTAISLDGFQLHADVVRMYDILGMNFTQVKLLKRSDQMFGKACNFLWRLIVSYANASMPKFADLIGYSPNKDPTEIAKQIFKICQKGTKKLTAEFVESFSRKTFVLTTRDIDGMKMHLKIDNSDLERIGKVVKQKQVLTDEDFSKLRELGMILTTEKMKNVFFAERLCSILHSRGRQMVYWQIAFEKDRYQWYSQLCYELAKIVRIQLKVGILAEYISVANNILPGMLKFLPKDGEKKKEILFKVKDLCKKCLDDIPIEQYYENGCFKFIKGTAYTQMNAYRYEVRANSKLTKYDEPVEDWKTKCYLLYGLSRGNCDLLVSSNCRIQCGKYMAAIGEYKQAIEAMESAICMEWKGKKYGAHITMAAQPSAFAWCVHNYGRAILAGNFLSENDILQKFNTWCNIALQSDCTKEWKDELRKLQSKINPSKLNSESVGYLPD